MAGQSKLFAKEIDDFKSDADIVYSIAYTLGFRHLSYEKFDELLKLAKGYEVIKLAKAAKFHSGHDFLVSLGFEFDDNDLLIICPLDEHDSTLNGPAAGPSTTFCEPVGAPGNHYQPPQTTTSSDVPFVEAQPYEVHIFDGDENKLRPGMHVQVAGGTVYQLPKISECAGFDAETTRRLQQKAGNSYRKKVRKMLEHHHNMYQMIEELKKVYDK